MAATAACKASIGAGLGEALDEIDELVLEPAVVVSSSVKLARSRCVATRP